MQKTTRHEWSKKCRCCKSYRNIQYDIFDWKNGKSTPKMDKIEKIAKYFGVTTDYMIGKKSEIPSASMADDHLELIKLYSSLSEADQKAIMQIMRSMNK